MTRHSTTIAAGMLAASLLGAPAFAGDYNNGAGGIKDYGQAAIPVPAPMPIQEAFSYYLRADVGYTATSSGTFSATGSSMPVTSPSELDGPWVVSGAVGRQFGPNTRLEVALSVRTNQRLVPASSTYNQVRTVAGAPLLGVATTDTGTYSVTRGEETYAKRHDLMLNYFYDFKGYSSHFTPYVGAGAGVSMHQLGRHVNETAVCTSATNSASGPYAGPCGGTLPVAGFVNEGFNRVGYGLAGSLMAGVAVELSPHVYWDTGYKMMWTSSKIVATTGTILGASSLNIGNTVGHEVRTGFRWDLW